MTARQWSWSPRWSWAKSATLDVDAFQDPGTFSIGLTVDRFRRGDLLVTLAFGPWSATGRWGR